MGMQIASSSNASQVSGAGKWQQQRQDFSQLSQALQSGDMNAAKQAFTSLSSKSPNAIDPNSPLGKLGAALQSGDVNAAQQAFASLRSGHHHHHHGAGNNTASAPASTAPAALATSGSVGTNVSTSV